MRTKKSSKKYLSLLLAVLMIVGMFPTGLTAYAVGEENHSHTAECYAAEGDLLCKLSETEGHTHTDECKCPGGELICGKEESEGHAHSEDCYAKGGELICGFEENEPSQGDETPTEHIHDESCYAKAGDLLCGLEENAEHTHSEDCYAKGGELICSENENIPISALENGDEIADFESLKNAITNAPENAETQLNLCNDIVLTETLNIPAGKNIVLLTSEESPVSLTFQDDPKKPLALIQISEGAQLTLSGNITLEGKRKVRYVDCYGTFVMNSGTMQKAFLTSDEKQGGIVVSGENASFQLNGGTIKDTTSDYAFTAAVYLTNKATAIMDGGYIQNNTFRNQFCGAVVVDNAEFTMNGGEISQNSSERQLQSAGGVLVLALDPAATADTAKSAVFNMNGGKIANNQSYRGGGVYVYGGSLLYGIDFYSRAKFIMNGGEITGNQTNGFSDLAAAGGGVYVEWAGDFTMNAGTISNNSTTGMGGGVATADAFTNFFGKNPYSSAGNRHYNDIYYRDWPTFFPAAFTMNGGKIVNNAAIYNSGTGDEGCGGGVYVASNNVTLNAGNISGNTSGKQGGGVYVGSVPYVLRMYDALITENSASVIGGGVWFCPTGEIDMYVNNGASLFGNTAEGAADDLATVHTSSSPRTTISDRMLGGGLANWYQDGAINTSSQLGNADSSVARYDPNSDNNIPVSGIVSRNDPFALKALPSKDAQELSASLAKLTITQNHSTRGGGIGSNGGVVIGKSYEGTRDLTVTKEWIGSTSIPKSVVIWLKINDYRVERIELTADNNWTATVTGLPTTSDIEITVEEESMENWQASYDYITLPSGDMAVTVKNTFQAVGSLKVSKTVSGNGVSKTDTFTFTVTLTDEDGNPVSGTFGDAVFDEDGKLTFTLRDGEEKVISDLPAGTHYKVLESDNNGYTVTVNGQNQTEAAGTIVAGETALAAFNNHKSGGSNPSPAKVTITAEKTLNGQAPNGSDYSFVLKDESGNVIQTVQNNGGSIAFNTLSFSKTGTYIYTISEAPGNDSAINYDTAVYKVIVKVAKSGNYRATVSYEKDGAEYDGIPVFANTTKPVDPENPDKPDTPDKPMKPSNPTDNVPQTGDNSHIGLWAALACLSLFGMIAVVFRRKRYSGNRSK